MGKVIVSEFCGQNASFDNDKNLLSVSEALSNGNLIPPVMSSKDKKDFIRFSMDESIKSSFEAKNIIEENADGSITVEIEGMHSDIVTRNQTSYSEYELRKSLREWTKPYNRPLIFHHNLYSGKVVGRVVGARISQESLRAKDIGSSVSSLLLRVKVYDKETIEGIKNGSLDTTSMSNRGNRYCSICGKEYDGGDCDHYRGEEYDGKICHVELRDLEPLEISIVNAPSDKYSGIVSVNGNPSFGVTTSSPESFSQEGFCIPPEYFSKEDKNKINILTESADGVKDNVIKDNTIKDNGDDKMGKDEENTNVEQLKKDMADQKDRYELENSSLITSFGKRLEAKTNEVSDLKVEIIEKQNDIDRKINEIKLAEESLVESNKDKRDICIEAINCLSQIFGEKFEDSKDKSLKDIREALDKAKEKFNSDSNIINIVSKSNDEDSHLENDEDIHEPKGQKDSKTSVKTAMSDYEQKIRKIL